MWSLLQHAEQPGCYQQQFLGEPAFRRLLRLEWKRSNHSGRRFVLLLLESNAQGGPSFVTMSKLMGQLGASTRETDIVGWYREDAVVGVIFTELGLADDVTVRNVLAAKVTKAISISLNSDQANLVRTSLQLFPTASDAVTALVDSGSGELRPGIQHQQKSDGSEVLVLKATNSSS